MKLIQRNYRIGKNHDVAIKKTAKKMKISESEVIRRRIKTMDEMVKELHEDLKHADHIDLARHSR